MSACVFVSCLSYIVHGLNVPVGRRVSVRVCLCVRDGVRTVVLHSVILKCPSVRVGCAAFVVCGDSVHTLRVSLCPRLCEVFVWVSPAGASSPSGAPASRLPLSSPGCDRSQRTPPLLWQPENSLEKGQLATFSPACPEPRLRGCVVRERPLLAVWPTTGPHHWGFPSYPGPPETSSWVNKGPSKGKRPCNFSFKASRF